jgi:hypothetical protein
VHGFLYRNAGDGTFTKITEGAPVTDLTTGVSGASWGDYDNDGFLDLFVSQGGFSPRPQTPLLYHNDGNANAWLNVRLVGTASNRSGIGAKVRVDASYRGAQRRQLREISGGDSESNQQSLDAEFGLADATSIDTIRVEWPSGIVQELHDIAPRQFLTITETLPIAIDVRPGTAAGPVQHDSYGVLPVAALGATDFDVREVDVATLALGPAGAAARSRGLRYRDVNGDGFDDLVAHYRTADAGLASDDEELCLTGSLRSGVPFAGCEAVTAVPSARSHRGNGRR